MGTQGCLDMPFHAILGVQLDRFEVFDILRLEEHISDNCFLLVTLKWISRENYSLKNATEWIWRHHHTSGRYHIYTLRFERFLCEA